jgi:hypothetical protein
MRIKLSRSTKLRIAAGVIIALAIAGIAVTIVTIPLAAPIVCPIIAAASSGASLAIVKDKFKQIVEVCLGMNNPPEPQRETPEEQDSHTVYRYHWAKRTKHLVRTDSGNHLDETTTTEYGQEDGVASEGEHPPRPPTRRGNHP